MMARCRLGLVWLALLVFVCASSVLATCGDGALDGTEACDDGNPVLSPRTPRCFEGA